jgi:hypothetical protein
MLNAGNLLKRSEGLKAGFLVDVSISLKFGAILQNHDDAEQEQNIDADYAECGGEDEV